MIQIYTPSNTDYEKNGDQTLFPVSASVHAILNGAWEAEITHPIDADGRWKYITEEAVIKMPSFNGDQLFRVKTAQKQDSGVTATLEPIFYDSMGDCWLSDVRPTGKNGQDALDIMLAPNSKYSGLSNITRAATAYYQNMNFMQALNGDIDQSFINRWGGEILFDNFTVIVNDRVGGDYGIELRYGKNIPRDGMSYEVDTRDVVTRIYPQAYNGYKMTGNGYVDSPLINNYPTVKAVSMTFDNVKMRDDAQEDDEENGVIICDTQEELDAALTQQCETQYDAGIDKPTVTISADMVLLQNTEQYKDIKTLEAVSLGDTIHCINTHLDITTDARVIEIEFDAVQKKVSSVVIGDFQQQYFDGLTDSAQKIDSVINPDGSLMAEKVQGILNGIYTQLRLQSTVAEKVNGHAFIVEDLDEESDLYGAMVWGTQGLQLSTTRTADGRGWDWTTAITAHGIVANTIITGILSDKTGKNYWNLDTGEFRLSAEAFKVDDQTVQDYVDGQIDEKIAQIRTLTMQLSNEFTGVATDSNGSGGDYSDCYTDVLLYIGSTDITESDAVRWTINPSAGVTGNWNEAQHRYSITYLSGDNGTVSISATYSGLVITKTFAAAKVKQGLRGLQGLQGEKGEQGIPGTNGTDGRTSYFHIKYSANASGNPMSETPNTYIGTYVDFTQADSNDYTDYTWSRFEGMQGEQGIPGTNGENGQTSYLHIKYSNDGGKTFTANNGETPGKYIGQYVDFTQADSTSVSKYTWSLTQGEDGRVYMIQASTQVLSQGADDAFTPPTVTFSAYYRDGQSASRTAYAGRFIIQETTDGTSYVTRWTSAANQTSVTYTPYSKDVKNIRCTLYAAGGTTNALDMQGVAIVRDVDNLTQQEIFNILTNNGAVQGIYMQDGQLYINAEYIKTGIISDGTGKSFWNLSTGNLQLSGDFQQTADNGSLSVAITDNQIKFYSWEDDGNYVGSVGAVKDNSTGKTGVEMWCDKGEQVILGCATEAESDANIKKVFSYDDGNPDSTPYIINTTNGTMFSNNPGGGVTVENGLIKKFDLRYITDGKMSVMTGIAWNSGNITRVDWMDIVIKSGMITAMTPRSTDY